ncbi:hypothetical protein Hanom_Chr08g00694031 [Helianthus anomalus]
MVELSAGMKISLILALTVECFARRVNVTAGRVVNRHCDLLSDEVKESCGGTLDWRREEDIVVVVGDFGGL